MDYGIPYFLQDFIFAYRGEQIPEISNASTWAEAIDLISTNDRFKPKNNKPNLMAIDDARTMFSIPSLISTNNVNPKNNESIGSLSDKYYKLSSKINNLGNNVMKLNTDANAVLNDLATNSVNGAFLFNGDALYASYGGDDGVSIDEQDFHIVKPSDTLVALDLFVFNKNMKSDKLDKAYKVVNELCLSFDTSDPENSLIYENFDYVNYTCTLKSLNDYVKSNYFDLSIQEEIYDIATPTVDSLEISIDNLTKSNLSFAWINFKNSLN